MEQRIDISKIEHTAYKALLGLESYLATSSISKTNKELIKIRASQINGCAFCINMHTSDARKNGETEQRIYLLNAWKEVAGLYTEEERIILAMTEEITLISKAGLSYETYQKAKSIFLDNEIAQIIMAIITINAWNRLAIATLLQPV
jgi:AhpD family alkylhydroperoxidase